jgi:hypothetical protein
MLLLNASPYGVYLIRIVSSAALLFPAFSYFNVEALRVKAVVDVGMYEVAWERFSSWGRAISKSIKSPLSTANALMWHCTFDTVALIIVDVSVTFVQYGYMVNDGLAYPPRSVPVDVRGRISAVIDAPVLPVVDLIKNEYVSTSFCATEPSALGGAAKRTAFVESVTIPVY